MRSNYLSDFGICFKKVMPRLGVFFFLEMGLLFPSPRRNISEILCAQTFKLFKILTMQYNYNLIC